MGEKMVTSSNLHEFLSKGKRLLGLSKDEDVYAVLEDDGTEVDEEEYFSLLADESILMILLSDQIWSPTISLKGNCIFDSTTNVLTSGQLASALMEHIKRVTLDNQEESRSPCKKKDGDGLNVDFVTEDTN